MKSILPLYIILSFFYKIYSHAITFRQRRMNSVRCTFHFVIQCFPVFILLIRKYQPPHIFRIVISTDVHLVINIRLTGILYLLRPLRDFTGLHGNIACHAAVNIQKQRNRQK